MAEKSFDRTRASTIKKRFGIFFFNFFSWESLQLTDKKTHKFIKRIVYAGRAMNRTHENEPFWSQNNVYRMKCETSSRFRVSIFRLEFGARGDRPRDKIVNVRNENDSAIWCLLSLYNFHLRWARTAALEGRRGLIFIFSCWLLIIHDVAFWNDG